MQTHQLEKPNNKSLQKKKKRIGRGGKRGTYSGRGLKGQKSRAGAKIRPQIREMVLKFPQKRGVYFGSLKKSPIVVKLKDIVAHFPEGGLITPQKLKKIKGFKIAKSKRRPIKILGAMPLSKSYIINNCLVSQKAKEAIEKAGGRIEK